MAHRHVDTPHEVVSENEEVEVKVLSVDQDEQRVSLSIKALEEALKEMNKNKPSKTVKNSPSVRQPSLRDEDDDSAFTIATN